MRPRGSAGHLESRRRRALKLLGQGRSLREVANLMACAASSVMRWRNCWQQGGDDGLRVRPNPGRPHKLNTRQRRQLVALLGKGPRAYGYETDEWTAVRIAELIQRRFQVHYHIGHVGRLMNALGWKPKI
jgi:transposase